MGEYKVVVMGSGGVGKSALTIQFVQGTFTEKYDPTIEDFYRKQMYVGEDPVTLEILDTAGTEQFASMRDLYIRNGQGFILVFSIINHQTFREVLNLHQQILRAKGTNQVPIVLVGNKLDLAEQMREVPTNYAETVAKDWGLPFLETSAKYSTNVEEVFKEVVRLMVAASHSRGRGRSKRQSKQQTTGCRCTIS
ncbi:ras-related protein Rap-2a-like [Convolutriloba macropyga]|uniref:ras-related protein Rap-2a-like n=1 Tax=Convolutriloba macropyga TaxID=536237 RepID=UPI003F51B8AF